MKAPALIGCCGWSEARATYLQHFPTIELQTPFYEPPTPALAEKWRAAAPPEFHFCIKAWQLITHTPASPTYRRLKSAISPEEQDLFGSFRPTEQVWLAWERTRQIARILKAKIILFQCPASFKNTPENIRNFQKFFEQIDSEDFRLAWEPRGPWPPALIQELCQQFNLIHCVDPFKADPVTTGPLYFRLHGRTGYGYRYTDEDLAELHQKLKTHRTKAPAYVQFNNIYMRDDAKRFQSRLL